MKGNLFEISVPDNTMKLVLSSAFLRVVRNLKDMDESKRRAAGRPLQGTGLTKSYLKTEMKKGSPGPLQLQDIVEITKPGSHIGKHAIVLELDWEGTGRVQVEMLKEAKKEKAPKEKKERRACDSRHRW